VDFAERRRLCEALKPLFAEPGSSADARAAALTSLLANWHDGRVKLFVTIAGLRLRQKLPEVFRHGEYLPIAAEGERADHIVAIARCFEGANVLAVVPRLIGRLGLNDVLPVGQDAWKETCLMLPPALRACSYRSVLTLDCLSPDRHDGALRAATILRTFPVAILVAN
jgi:(1->4)-alpha-D-glucan 1-alpha-D-glucosylmutase